MKKLIQIFLISFTLNFIWENLHSFLYVHYQGQAITELILFRAALFDACFITLVGWLFITIPFLHKRLWLIWPIGIIFAIGLEMFALNSNRWAYNELMPIIPLLEVGLSPTIQLALTGYISWKMAKLN